MARRLTDYGVQALRAKDKIYEIADGTTGLRLAVFPSGAKSWIARYRRPGSGKTAKLTVGKYPGMSLAQARVRVSEARASVGKGADPGEDKRRRRIADKQAELDLEVKLQCQPLCPFIFESPEHLQRCPCGLFCRVFRKAGPRGVKDRLRDLEVDRSLTQEHSHGLVEISAQLRGTPCRALG
jgi:hypothetical protein